MNNRNKKVCIRGERGRESIFRVKSTLGTGEKGRQEPERKKERERERERERA